MPLHSHLANIPYVIVVHKISAKNNSCAQSQCIYYISLTVSYLHQLKFINQNYIHIYNIIFATTGIPRFTLLMWGHIKKRGNRKPRKSRLLSSTKGEENRIEL